MQLSILRTRYTAFLISHGIVKPRDFVIGHLFSIRCCQGGCLFSFFKVMHKKNHNNSQGHEYSIKQHLVGSTCYVGFIEQMLKNYMGQNSSGKFCMFATILLFLNLQSFVNGGV